MKRSRGNIKRYIESSDSDDNRPLKKSPPNIEKPEQNKSHGSSSSESDIENYLQRPDKLNLDSEFFNMIKYDVSKFENIEKNVFSGVRQLSDTSESENEDESRISKKEKRKPGSFLKVKLENSASSKITFDQLQDYTKKIEEAKKHIEIYRAKKQAEENKIDILNLLAAGERKIAIEQKLTPADLHSSDFESCESDQEDWEEIRMKAIQENSEKNIVPQRGLQITLDMSDNVKKKKDKFTKNSHPCASFSAVEAAEAQISAIRAQQFDAEAQERFAIALENCSKAAGQLIDHYFQREMSD